MEKRIAEYILIVGQGPTTVASADKLSAEVTKYIELGWKLRGKMKTLNGFPCQVMVKKKIVG